jgi:hypothetical protein
MVEVISEPAAIEQHLRELRHLDKEIFDGPARTVVDFFLDMHQITVEPGPEDMWCDSEIPLRGKLSLFDSDRRRQRVSEIRIDAAFVA